MLVMSAMIQAHSGQFLQGRLRPVTVLENRKFRKLRQKEPNLGQSQGESETSLGKQTERQKLKTWGWFPVGAGRTWNRLCR